MDKHFKRSGLEGIAQLIGFNEKMTKTLNLHFTDRCNFSCKHCFINMSGKELNLDECKTVIDKVSEMSEFSRINLAGGEPMLAPHLQEVIDYVVTKGFKCSIITNGSLLTDDFIIHNQNKLSMIGISIDAMDDTINKIIGRKTLKDIEHLVEMIKNYGIILKINICVSKINKDVDFTSFIERLKPDRLKIFQILPSPHLKNADLLTLTEKEFSDICHSLRRFNPVCENNDYMLESYWIVDSEGYYGQDNLHIISSPKIKLL